MEKSLKIAVIGGGASGFFSAITAKQHFPQSKVVLFEKTNKVLSKVKISGGGRCNVTNNCFDINELAKNYPRGENFLRKAFNHFSTKDTIAWFESQGVELYNQADNRIFPKSNDSQTIVNCLLTVAENLGVVQKLNTNIISITKKEELFCLKTTIETFEFERVILTVGGIPKLENMTWLQNLGCKMIAPVPSLFTFNMPKNPIIELMGASNELTHCRIEKEKLQSDGALLVTHWGMSGPAVLKLSAWGARLLAEKNYDFNLLVNWANGQKEDDVRSILLAFLTGEHSGKKIETVNPFGISKRLWNFLLEKTEISNEMRWNELGKKNLNKLTNQLINDFYAVKGKTTFKEEFVTAGGVALSQVDVNTMQHKEIKGLFFAGEVLDIDGITGGFNFQAAWTTGFIAGKSVGGF